ncbi:MAG: NYN domain-containing protein [Candidatus Electrothrix sp. MAN1_4]|nr:NYN domain-containing protein [Candidatus Electrothrix sp. MAN1_4]
MCLVVGGILLLSGDGDFVPLVREVVHTSKQMYVGAFSLGLSEALRNEVDMFIDLDPLFFN